MSRPDLKSAQVWMVSAITGAEVDADAADRWLTASSRMTARERLDVYRLGYHARLEECLRDDYPVLASTLGDDAFGALCRAYVGRHPSRSPNLNAFGRQMSAFLREAELPGVSPELRAFGAELAALEWALVDVLHAEAPEPLDVAAFAKLPVEAWAGARLVKSDAVRLLRFEHPVNAYYKAFMRDEAPAVPSPAPSAVVVYRREPRIWRMDLTPAMVSVLAPLLDGETIGDALEHLEADESDPEALAAASRDVMVWFREWVDAGLFARVELASDVTS